MNVIFWYNDKNGEGAVNTLPSSNHHSRKGTAMTKIDSNIEHAKSTIRIGRSRALFVGALLFLLMASVAPFAETPAVRNFGIAAGMIATGVILTAVFMPRAEEIDIDAIVAEMPRNVDDVTDDERMIDAEWRDKLNDLASPGGFVYVIRDITVTGRYKIGRSTSVNRRFLEFAAKFPFQYTVIHIIASADSHELESVLHRQFAAKRVSGSEWFSLTPDDVRWIKRLETC